MLKFLKNIPKILENREYSQVYRNFDIGTKISSIPVTLEKLEFLECSDVNLEQHEKNIRKHKIKKITGTNSPHNDEVVTIKIK